MLIDADEALLARSRFDVCESLGKDLPGGGFEVVVVTDLRIVWGNTHRTASLRFADIREWTEVRQFHRYAMVLRHAPVERVEWEPAHRVLWFRWGNAYVNRPRVVTVVVFSHDRTKPAQAIRERLSHFGVPREGSVRLPRTKSRDQGHAVLHRLDS